MAIPNILYDEDGNILWTPDDSKQSLQDRSEGRTKSGKPAPTIWEVEKALFLSEDPENVETFKELMKTPRTPPRARTPKLFRCKQPLELRLKGSLDDVKKGSTIEKIHNGIKTLKKYNVPFKLNILLGASPLETSETIKHTLATAKNLEPNSIMVGICNPFPGTEFWEIAKRERWLLTPEYQPVDVQKESTIAYPHLSKEDLEKTVRAANINFFLRPKFILKSIMNTKNPIALIKSSRSLLKKLTKPE